MKIFYKQTPVIFNRKGAYWYYDRLERKVWYEGNGNAYLDKNDQIDHFKYALNRTDPKRLRKIEMAAIKVLINSKLCPKNLRELYDINVEIEEQRIEYIKMKISLIKYLKENNMNIKRAVNASVDV